MLSNSILFIGNVEKYIRLICQALMKGYRIIYLETPQKQFSFLNQERIRLVIVDELSLNTNNIEHLSFIKFIISSNIPIILMNKDILEEIIMKLFTEPIPLLFPVVAITEEVKNSIRCFLNGELEKIKNNCLIITSEKDFISLELKEDGDFNQIHKGICEAIFFMKKNYNENINLRKAASVACLNSDYFCRLFKKEVGMNWNQYLSLMRIEVSKSLLNNTQLSISEIAYQVGFNSLTHFERVFKDIEEITPSKYRSKENKKYSIR